MSAIPREMSLDSTGAMLREGYTFISTRCERLQSDIFETRIMLAKAICMMGAEAAREFYEPDRFTRKQALPKSALWLLQDQGSAQVLGGAAHRHRKQMFMSLMTPASIGHLSDLVAEEWRSRIARWQGRDEIVLHQEVEDILCRSVCRWAGIPLTESESPTRTREFAAMIDGAGAVGPRNWRGLLLRRRTERWARDVVDRLRSGETTTSDGVAAQVVSRHRDLDGKLLDIPTAAVELINVLRPTVAVARYITFGALALHDHPEWRERLQTNDDEPLEFFVQELRRYYPFFPVVAGRVLQEFDWRGHRFGQGQWVILDLYGTNHDPRSWQEPHRFRPERFRHWDGSPYNFIPQGGGDHFADHRCAGEWIAIELVKTAMRLLTREMTYRVPAQDLRVDLSRVPAIPNSRFLIDHVQGL
ncbi:cytochrome P450 [Microvirga makkahensis]|uniref:Cytochrome P450 n=1 Tax=Microvirga makkahensis TaxID=1128670 RepID=A0A7X3SNA0_9HYPH|nr:cytochrome P450 [Microvirga makkahensis]MXQ10849.1 cytochrome P450 [Microvirga makkahensis]